MARFPTKEAEVFELAQEMMTGLAANAAALGLVHGNIDPIEFLKENIELLLAVFFVVAMFSHFQFQSASCESVVSGD